MASCKNVCDLTALFTDAGRRLNDFKTFINAKSVDKLQNCATNSINLIQTNSKLQVFV